MGEKAGVNKIVANAKKTAHQTTQRVFVKAEDLKRQVGRGIATSSEKAHPEADKPKKQTQAEINQAIRDSRKTEKE